LGLIIYLPTRDDNEQLKSNPGNEAASIESGYTRWSSITRVQRSHDGGFTAIPLLIQENAFRSREMVLMMHAVDIRFTFCG